MRRTGAGASRERGDAERRPGVPAAGAEHVVEQAAGAVDHRGLLGEVRGGGDEAEHGQHPADPVERAELGPQHRQRVERAPARGLAPLLHGHVPTEDAGVHDRAVEVSGQLTRGAGGVAVHDHGVERFVREVRTGQLDPELVEPGVGPHGRTRSSTRSRGPVRDIGRRIRRNA
jgi:hypothetical protein